jgi:hypothetical protein
MTVVPVEFTLLTTEPPLASFVAERLEFDRTAKTSWNDLQSAYQAYASQHGLPGTLTATAKSALSRGLTQHGASRKETGAARIWEGVRLK